jgi:hypothetical protein
VSTSNWRELRAGSFDTWQGFDWLAVTLARTADTSAAVIVLILLMVVGWVLASCVAVVFLGAYAMSDRGAELNLYGRRRVVYPIAALATLFVVPVGIGLAAEAAGITRWLWALLLLPHGAVAILLTVMGIKREL